MSVRIWLIRLWILIVIQLLVIISTMFMIRVKVLVVQVSPVVVAVAVINMLNLPRKNGNFLLFLTLLLGALCFTKASALVLPEDRADVLYHNYDGGGAEISGPSILIRKKFSENISASFNNYVDNVSSASIDVITSGASEYTEEREENSINLDYLHNKTLMSLGFTDSSESDYEATTVNINFSQDFFGDLTTLSMGFAMGDNTVKSNADPDFEEDLQSRSYRVSLSQVITQDTIMSFAFEAITDEGFLNNPYRSVRYYNSLVPIGYSTQAEKYPNTRTSNAFAVRARYYLSQNSTLHAGYRYFTDDWGIEASTFDLGYSLPVDENWLLELTYRYYDQTRADFYSDLLPFGGPDNDPQTFWARDKELSTFNDNAIGVGATYEFKKNGEGFIKRGTANLFVDYISFKYDDFRDLTKATAIPGEEPLYEMNATVLRIFVSIWF
jgi:opacity protein-like surface antigen